MNRYFTAKADREYRDWYKSGRKTLQKINELIDDIEKNGLADGRGKPEQLKYFDEPTWRIDKANRLVYRPHNENDLLIISCKGHYEDK